MNDCYEDKILEMFYNIKDEIIFYQKLKEKLKGGHIKNQELFIKGVIEGLNISYQILEKTK